MPSGPALYECGQQGKLVREVDKHMLQVAFPRAHLTPARCLSRVARLTPRSELPRHGLLNGLAVAEIDAPAQTHTNEVALVECERSRQGRGLDQAADPIGCRRDDPKPVPTPSDHFAQRADRQTSLLLLRGQALTHEIAHRRWLAFPCQADFESRHFCCLPAMPLQYPPVYLEPDAVGIMRGEDLIERRVQEGLVLPAQRALQKTLIQQG